MKKLFLLLLTGLMVLSCGTSVMAKGLEKVTVSEAVRGFFFLPLYVAQGMKFFEEQGLDVTIDSTQGGPLAMQALAAGQVQFCATGHGQVANMWAMGKSTKIVNQMQNKCTFYLVGRPEIDNIAGLKGKTVGCTKLGSETFAVGRYLAAAAGLDPAEDIEMLGVGGMATMAGALENSRVQAIVTWQPLTSRLLASGKGKLLAKLNTSEDSRRHFNSPEYSFSVLQTTDEFIAQNPETVQKFVNGLVAAEKWLMETEIVRIAEVVSPYFPGMDSAVLKRSLAEDRASFTATGLVSRVGHDTAVTVFTDAGILVKPVSFEAIVDNSFTEKALAR